MIKGHRVYHVDQVANTEPWYVKHCREAWSTRKQKRFVRTLDAAKAIAQRVEEEVPTAKGIGLVRVTNEVTYVKPN